VIHTARRCTTCGVRWHAGRAQYWRIERTNLSGIGPAGFLFVEHASSSIPRGKANRAHTSQYHRARDCWVRSTRGFGPPRAEPNRFQVHHLSHPVKLSH